MSAKQTKPLFTLAALSCAALLGQAAAVATTATTAGDGSGRTTIGTRDAGTTSGRMGVTDTDSTALRANAVTFPSGSSQLTEPMRSTLRKLVNDARSQEIRDVYVVAYADRLRPADAALPEADQRLARERARAVQSFIEGDVGAEVTTFNMARRANWFSRLFDTQAAQVQEPGAGANDRLAQVVRQHGKPSAVVVVVEHEAPRGTLSR